MRELLDELSTVTAGRRELCPGEFGDDVELLDLPAAVLDHLGDGSLFRAETANCLLHVAPGVVLAVAPHQAAAHREVGVGAVGSGSGLQGQLVQLLQLLLVHFFVVHPQYYL